MKSQISFQQTPGQDSSNSYSFRLHRRGTEVLTIISAVSPGSASRSLRMTHRDQWLHFEKTLLIPALSLCVADLRWVQVNSSEEAYRVMKIGKKNQSFSATRLNQLSSRRSERLKKRLKRSSHVGAGSLNEMSSTHLPFLSPQPQHLLHPDPPSGRRRRPQSPRHQRVRRAHSLQLSHLLTVG